MTTKTVPVARRVGEITESCHFGAEHRITYVQVKRLVDTGRRQTVDNGYETVEERILLDRQGREYLTRSPIDFSGGTLYMRQTDRAVFGRMPSGMARDITGRPLTPKTPPGPAWTPPAPDPAGVPL